jgi:di/tricarboxylate transporter
MTLIGTSTNLIIAGLIFDRTGQSLNIFFPTLVALPIAVIGIAFLIFLGVRLLPKGEVEIDEGVIKRFYGAEFVVMDGSNLVGKTAEEAGLADGVGYQLKSIQSRPSETNPNLGAEAPDRKPALVTRIANSRIGALIFRRRRSPVELPVILAEQILDEGDLLTFKTDIEALPALWTTIGLLPYVDPMKMESKRYFHQLVEVAVASEHPAVGRKISELPIRDDPPNDVRIVAFSHDGEPPDGPIKEQTIQSGDNGVLEVSDSFFYDIRNEREFLLTRPLRGYQIQRVSRAVIASVITVVAIVVVAVGWMSMLNAALLATGAMLLTGCMTLKAAGRSIEWDTLIVLAAAIGLESAVTQSGLAAVIADLLTSIGGGNPYLALAVVFIGCIVMTNLITNAAAAAFMFPIALSISQQLGVNFEPFAVILMLGTSYAFINPAGYQTNLMVLDPGGYLFGDFAKVGIPLTIIAGILAVVLAPLIFGC